MTLSRGNRHLRRIPAVCRNYKTMLADSPDLDMETQSVKDRFELSIGRAFRRIKPNDQDSGRGQKFHEPIQRGLKGLDGTSLPIDQCDPVLTERKPAGRDGRDAAIPAAMQGQHEVRSPRARDNDAMKLGAA